jgi:hypothetical protein
MKQILKIEHNNETYIIDKKDNMFRVGIKEEGSSVYKYSKWEPVAILANMLDFIYRTYK